MSDLDLTEAIEAAAHRFLPVAGHPDDDECTYRSDGTDATYCGEPKAAHERQGRDLLDTLTAAVRLELEQSAESDVVAVSDYAISLIIEAVAPLIAKQARVAVAALHVRQDRWQIDDAERSYESVDALTDAEFEVDDTINVQRIHAFAICAECGRIEMSVEQGDERAYLESLWPCPTARALGVEA